MIACFLNLLLQFKNKGFDSLKLIFVILCVLWDFVTLNKNKKYRPFPP